MLAVAAGDDFACAVVAVSAESVDAGEPMDDDAGPPAEDDAGPADAGPLDAGPLDGGVVEGDAGPAFDAGPPADAGPAPTDAGPAEADAGPLDAGASESDAGGPSPDAGPASSAGVGTLRCWGRGSRRAMTLINGLPAVADAALGPASCALDGSGRAWCWGANEAGELGDGTRTSRTQARAITGLSSAVGIQVSSFVEERGFACAQVADALQCWGANDRGQLGDGTAADRPRPGAVPGLDQVRAFALGDAFACALEGQSIFCWGAGDAGQLGRSGGDLRQPEEVTSLGPRRFVSLATGAQHACALDVAGEVWCWGADDEGQLGRGGTLPSRPMPAVVGGLPLIVEVAAGARHTCARSDAGEVYCWGGNGEGQVGQAGVPRETRPRRVSIEGASSLALGADFSCALTGSALRCWGNNAEGQLGDETTISSPRPVTTRGL